MFQSFWRSESIITYVDMNDKWNKMKKKVFLRISVPKHLNFYSHPQ